MAQTFYVLDFWKQPGRSPAETVAAGCEQCNVSLAVQPPESGDGIGILAPSLPHYVIIAEVPFASV